MGRSEDESKKSFREAFYKRLSDGSKLSEISRATGIAQDTLYSWAQPERGLPDIYEATAIARAKKAHPNWLAFGLGARDPHVAEAAERLEKVLAADPELREVLEHFSNTTKEGRAAILATSRIAPKAADAAPAPASASAAKGSVAALLPRAEELEALQSQLQDKIADMPAETEAYETALSAAELLNQINAVLRAARKRGSSSGTGASTTKGDPADAKRSQDHTQELPLELPPGAKPRSNKRR